MASNRDPRPSYRRRNRAKPTSSSTRAKRTKASTAPKPTSSTQRRAQQGKGSARVTSDKGRVQPVKKNPVSKTPRGAQGPKSPPVQGPNKKVSGIIGTRKGSTSTPPKKAPPTPGTKLRPKTPKSVIKPTTKLKGRGGRGGLAGLAMTAAEMAARRGVLGKTVKASFEKGDAQMDRFMKNPLKKDTTGPRKKPTATKKKPSSSVGKYNTRDSSGTVRSRKKVGAKKVGAKKVGTASQSFDKSFAAARKAGKKEFTWKGKRYNTKVK